MFTWSDEKIAWYRAAMEQTRYNELLADEAADFFQKNDIVYDIGCGPGYHSIALSPLVRHLTSVDIEPKALDILHRMMAERGITNITPLKSDYMSLKAECCDTVFICAFAVLDEDFSHLMRLAKKRLVVVKRKGVHEKTGFGERYKRFDAAGRDEAFLKTQGIPFRLKSFQADFGQPLKDYDDARRFIEHYSLKPDDEPLDAYLESYRLGEHDKTYRYYLPNVREVHILVVEKGDVKGL